MLRNLNKSHRLVDLFLELVKIDGTSRRELAVRQYLVKFLKNLGLEPKVDNAGDAVGGNTGNIICQIGDGGDFVGWVDHLGFYPC